MTFMRIIRLMTSSQERMQGSIYYCHDILLFQNVQNLQYIVEK